MVFEKLAELVSLSHAPFVIHTHEPTRTMADARKLPFDPGRIVKTVAFRTRGGQIVLAAVRGINRIDYPRLAALAGVKRRDIAPLSGPEVESLLGVEPGGVSPICPREDVTIFIDLDVLTIEPTIFCGFARLDKTLEIAPGELLNLARAKTGEFSRPGPGAW